MYKNLFRKEEEKLKRRLEKMVLQLMLKHWFSF